jgi:hypothetical protein
MGLAFITPVSSTIYSHPLQMGILSRNRIMFAYERDFCSAAMATIIRFQSKIVNNPIAATTKIPFNYSLSTTWTISILVILTINIL